MPGSRDLAEGWVVWHEEPDGRVVLAYRPDVFDTQAFPAACMPTIMVAPGVSPNAPPERREASGMWYVALYLEPMVRVREVDVTYPTRDEAVRAAGEVAGAFAEGSFDYHALYNEPRAGYLDALDSLIG